MNNFRKRLKRKALKVNVEIKDAVNAYIQPFKEVPSVNNTEPVNASRIDAHDLFSLYTANIIKKDTIFFR